MRAALVSFAALAVLAGCGSSGQGDATGTPAADPVTPAATSPSVTTPTPSEKPLPPCARSWRGATLPENYAGCQDGAQRVTTSLRCETGQQLFTRGKQFAIPGARIFTASGALADDPQFRKMHRVCRA